MANTDPSGFEAQSEEYVRVHGQRIGAWSGAETYTGIDSATFQSLLFSNLFEVLMTTLESIAADGSRPGLLWRSGATDKDLFKAVRAMSSIQSDAHDDDESDENAPSHNQSLSPRARHDRAVGEVFRSIHRVEASSFKVWSTRIVENSRWARNVERIRHLTGRLARNESLQATTLRGVRFIYLRGRRWRDSTLTPT